ERCIAALAEHEAEPYKTPLPWRFEYDGEYADIACCVDRDVCVNVSSVGAAKLAVEAVNALTMLLAELERAEKVIMVAMMLREFLSPALQKELNEYDAARSPGPSGGNAVADADGE